jgi:hypothetical protein
VTHLPAWAPEDVEIETPSAARMYDFHLGGSHDFAADRALAAQNQRVWPDLGAICRANRSFLHRAVRTLALTGVRQFLDPEAAAVYVDADPVSRPVAVVMNSVLPFVPEEDDPAALAAAYRDSTVPGSYPVLSHATDEYRP